MAPSDIETAAQGVTAQHIVDAALQNAPVPTGTIEASLSDLSARATALESHASDIAVRVAKLESEPSDSGLEPRVADLEERLKKAFGSKV